MSLLAHYKLNSDANDASGNGHHGAPTDVSYVAGKIGQAGNFNGSTSGVNCGDPEALKLTVFSISAWVRSDRAVMNAGYYWPIAYRGSPYLGGYGIHFYDTSTPGLQGFQVWLRDGTFKGCLASNVYDPLSGWNHVVGTFDGATMTIYINGNYANQASSAGVVPDTSAHLVMIGDGEGPYMNYKWHGDIDDVRIYDEALPLRKIKAIYNFGKGSEECEPWQRLIRRTIRPAIQPLIGAA